MGINFESMPTAQYKSSWNKMPIAPSAPIITINKIIRVTGQLRVKLPKTEFIHKYWTIRIIRSPNDREFITNIYLHQEDSAPPINTPNGVRTIQKNPKCDSNVIVLPKKLMIIPDFVNFIKFVRIPNKLPIQYDLLYLRNMDSDVADNAPNITSYDDDDNDADIIYY